MSQSTPGATATELSQLLAKGDITALDLANQYLDRIETNADQSVFIAVTRGRALEEAKASDERRFNGRPLSDWDGIPVAWKDLFDMKGEVTTAGSKVYMAAEPASRDAEVVENCARMGLICLGKTNLSEFAYTGLGLNPHHGTPVNPHSGSGAHVPGGSSSGSAVAVAAGLAPVAMGTDTAGSVRVPASFCGVCGFKSSQDRYPTSGVFPLSSSLDSLGPFAHCVDDLIGMDSLMRGSPISPMQCPDPGDLEILIPETIVFDGMEPSVLASFDETVHRLADAGIRISREPFPVFDEVTNLFKENGTLTVAEAATLHQELMNSDLAEMMDRNVRERIQTAGNFTAQNYIKLQWARMGLQKSMSGLLGHRFLLFPTVAMTAPVIRDLELNDDLFVTTNLKALRNTMLGSYLGTPGVSLPIGANENGLPIGALLSAPFGQDDRVLAAAKAMEPLLKQ